MFEDIINLVVSNGMATAIVVYFLYKDYKFNTTITQTLSEIKEVLGLLKHIVNEREVKNNE